MSSKGRLIMSLKIWAVIYPSITLFLILLGDRIASFPLYQRTFILTVTLVPWMTFIGIPLVDLLLKRLIRTPNK